MIDATLESLSAPHLLDALPSATLLIRDHIVLFANRQALTMTGYTAEMLCGKNLHDLIPTAYHNQLKGWRKELFSTLRLEIMTGQNSCLPVEMVLAALPEAESTVWAATLSPAAKQPPVEQSQPPNIFNQQFKFLVDRVSDIILVTNGSSGIDYISPSIEAVLGYTARELQEHASRDLIHPDDLLKIMSIQPQLRREDGEARLEIRVKSKSGAYIWMEMIARAVYDPEKAHFRTIAIARDIDVRKRTEDALRETNDRYRALIDAIPDLIFRMAADGTYLDYKPVARERLLVRPEEFMGKRVVEVHAPEMAAQSMENIELALKTGMTQTFEYTVVKPDHSIGYYEARMVPSADQTVLSLVRDVTLNKQAENNLRASEERLRMITDHSSDIIFQISDQLMLEYVSPSIRRMLGYEPEDVVNRFVLNYVHPEDQATIAKQIQDTVANQQTTPVIEFRVRHADGHYRWMDATGNIIVDQTGKVTGLVANARDITERKRFEETLRENEQRLRLITDNAHDLVAHFDPEGKFVYVNPAHEVILGYKSHELIGKLASDFIHPDDIPNVQGKIETAWERGAPARNELRFRHAEGYYVWLESIGNAIRDELTGEITGFIFSTRDVTDRKRMERAVLEGERLQVELQKEQEHGALKTHMMRRLSHEFRNPLSVIFSSAELLDHYGHRMTHEKQHERLQQIHEQVVVLTDLLDDMAIIIKGVSNQMQFAPTLLHLRSLIEHIIHDQGAKRRSIELMITDIDQPVYVDERLMRQMIGKLLNNALKFSPEDSLIRLHVSAVGSRLVLTMKDNGIGVLPEERDRIFEAFFRGTNILGEVPGLGIGLTIVKEAVSLHRGTIKVDSIPGKETVFTVSLPLSLQTKD